jgi:hypothetical protein
VFGLPVTTAYTIGSLRYEAKETEIDTETSFTASVSQRIIYHLMPNLNDFDFESIAERVLHEVKGMNTSFPRFSHSTDNRHQIIFDMKALVPIYLKETLLFLKFRGAIKSLMRLLLNL